VPPTVEHQPQHLAVHSFEGIELRIGRFVGAYIAAHPPQQHPVVRLRF